MTRRRNLGLGLLTASLAVLGSTIALTACRSAGPYGYAKNYEPLGDEETKVKAARDYDPVMAERRPEDWQNTPVTFFGVVTDRKAGKSEAIVRMSLRRLESRNLCENGNDEDSCRVTVTDAEFGTLQVALHLTGEDDVGPRSVGIGSLLRVVGKLTPKREGDGTTEDSSDGPLAASSATDDVSPHTSFPLVTASFYRHWPRNTYVTGRAAEHMRQ